MSLSTVYAALTAMVATLQTLPDEGVRLVDCDGRWLAQPLVAVRDQPPFDASAMDGWAVRAEDLGLQGLAIVGESAAGRAHDAPIGPAETVRISTGAPLPVNADRVIMQEEATRVGDRLRVQTSPDGPSYIRRRASDYGSGSVLLERGVRLNPWRLALAASSGRAELACARRPRVRLLASGDEVVEPGVFPGPHQIHDAAGTGVLQIALRAGAEAGRLPVVDDTLDAITDAVRTADCDLLVTIGGASVGDHDLIKPAARRLGADLVVEGVAMRPGKPVWFATLPDGRRILGLPGNPVSAMVCAELFLVPVLAALQGGVHRPRFEVGRTVCDLAANGPREHYMRAVLRTAEDGAVEVVAAGDQDSSLVTVLAASNGLLHRAVGADAVPAGGLVRVMRLDV